MKEETKRKEAGRAKQRSKDTRNYFELGAMVDPLICIFSNTVNKIEAQSFNNFPKVK